MCKIAFVGGKLVDGTGAAPVEDSLVLVEDKKIAYAGPRTEVPEGYEVRDIQGRTYHYARSYRYPPALLRQPDR